VSGAWGPTLGAVVRAGGGHTTCSAAELRVAALGVGLGFSTFDFGARAGAAASRTGVASWTAVGVSTECCTTLDRPLSAPVGFRVSEATCHDGKPTSAIVSPATETTPMATATTTSRFVVREGGGGASGGGDGREVERDSASICDLLCAVFVRDTMVVRFDRVCFFFVFRVCTTPSPTSADTSNIHRIFRPARSAGIVTACFGMATSAWLETAIRVPAGFARKRAGWSDGRLQKRPETNQFDCRLVLSYGSL